MMLIRVRVGPSPIQGMGLFALDPVPKGSPIWCFVKGFDREFTPAEFAALPLLAQAHVRRHCFVRQDTGIIVLSGDHAGFINHSLTPNTGAPPVATLPVTTVALENIKAGVEITCNYFDYDADTPWKLGQVPDEAPLGARAGH